MPEDKGSLIGNNTKKWWQSRTIWVTVITFGAAFAIQQGTDAALVDKIKTVGEALIAIFLRLGILYAPAQTTGGPDA